MHGFPALKSAVIQVNLRLRQKITEQAMRNALTGVDASWPAHVHAVLTEVPLEHVRRLMTEEGITAEQLRGSISWLPASMMSECSSRVSELLLL